MGVRECGAGRSRMTCGPIAIGRSNRKVVRCSSAIFIAATRSSLPASSGSDRTCTARRCRRPNRRPAWSELGQVHAERVQMQPGDRLVEVLGQRIDPERIPSGLVKSSIWASTCW